MSERALELLTLPEDEPCFVLDIGCGSGLSGSVLDEQGHFWVGVDISSAMLGKLSLFAILACNAIDRFPCSFRVIFKIIIFACF